MATATLAVPINAELIGELFLRSGETKSDIAGWIEQVVRDYLDRTADDGNWSEAYYSWRAKSTDSENFRKEFGDPKGGHHWAPLFLPNGTLIRMEYKRRIHNAAVKFDRIEYQGESYSPSELARKVAADTSRNAWRDLYIKRPGDTEWVLADDLRRRQRS